jgi:hypothetical protein
VKPRSFCARACALSLECMCECVCVCVFVHTCTIFLNCCTTILPICIKQSAEALTFTVYLIRSCYLITHHKSWAGSHQHGNEHCPSLPPCQSSLKFPAHQLHLKMLLLSSLLKILFMYTECIHLGQAERRCGLPGYKKVLYRLPCHYSSLQ